MGWHYKNPNNFAAFYPQTLREAALQPNVSIPIYHHARLHEVSIVAANHRHFRYCIRKEPEACPDLFQILSDYEVRTQVKTDPVGSILYLTAKTSRVSDLLSQNPDLADEILNGI